MKRARVFLGSAAWLAAAWVTLASPASGRAAGCGSTPGCDVCVDGGDITASYLRIVNLGTPPGDDRLTVKGTMAIAQSSTIAPETYGLRVVLRAADGATVVDAELPGGAYGGAGQAGWVVAGKGSRFQYRTGSAVPPTAHGIAKVTLALRPRTPGFLQFKIEGKASDYRVLATGLPLYLAVVVDPAHGVPGQCADESFDAEPAENPERCRFDANGTGVVCR